MTEVYGINVHIFLCFSFQVEGLRKVFFSKSRGRGSCVMILWVTFMLWFLFFLQAKVILFPCKAILRLGLTF